MFVHSINPDLFFIWRFPVRFYGIVYVLGFLFFYKVLPRKTRLSVKQADDMLTWAMAGMIICARLFHVIFEFDYYIRNPVEALFFWHGGLAFIGGLIGTFAGAYLWCKKNNFNVWKIADVAVTYVPFFLALGRIANFLNSEHWGYPSSLPWCVVFEQVDSVCRHPAQLYEFGLKMLLFVAMLVLSKRKEKPGFLFWNFIWLYGVTRIIAELFRYNDVIVLGFSRMQYISAFMIILGLYKVRKYVHSR